MKKVSNSLTDPGYGSGWFKIAEEGYSNGKWAVDNLIANGGVQTITIPSCIAPGKSQPMRLAPLSQSPFPMIID